MANHEIHIQRCIDIAKNGLGSTAPNPMVGALIVHNNKIIGEGYTSAYGGHHAEVNAINSVKNKDLLNEATLYVTLEPCSHFGKTPPCSDVIIKHQIPKVVIGCIDDNPEVAGKGIAKLKAAGCDVSVGVLEDQCKAHHQRFFTFHNKKRPYIILKWAETSDGFIAPQTKDKTEPVWITNIYSRQLVHKWRAEEQAILVGTNTVLEDNPSLTVRDWTGQNPIRFVIDRNHKLSKKHAVFNSESETICISENEVDFKNPLAQEICSYLHSKDINSVIIEGGLRTLQTFIDENLWDEARIFTGRSEFKTGTQAPKISGKLISEQTIVEDYLKIYVNN
ncbi:bifunctional diaminohydroxyphosphoribosylaminopyrimidine deaminase/5-amino-6-(5-phosphoribosylamino)uracil reductase RibD [Psychroserpens sp.]|uniref:bifunctional diaminohydroxyphosphoribosylaminopyrimidine deaminase/5-amino-6-(5-phosphoribosylamino)uracil reductase RibD n=1 Tax=Psychroserpens sp. TaxID=2020870 RepID=UPI002B2689F7|nr:bifunctional diaminohydroxyphosphoribosylaminopyrimidine deaminase/5-amino-6-(5-phosphoribosylamino)uracil reductase RibD [Psychroserpens sp.]